MDLRITPQGTVVNNLEPDHLAGPKALISQPLQTTNPMIASILEILVVHGNELHLFRSKEILYWCRASDKAAVGTTFNALSYHAV